MSTTMTAAAVLEREFLGMRARLIDLAAALDRIDRAEGSLAGHAWLAQLRQALEILGREGPGRAERLQSLFSLPYQDNWRTEYGL
jgi:hypothetical protein